LSSFAQVMVQRRLGGVEERQQLVHADLAGVLAQEVDELESESGRRAPDDARHPKRTIHFEIDLFASVDVVT
jgi:hypothetical protein